MKLNKPESKNSDFGRRLKGVFTNASNQSIAKELKLSNSALTAYIQGRIPPPDKLIEIAKLTGCDLNWLLTGQYSKNNNFRIKRPQGIILQGNRGGIGTSFSAGWIAANLALRGYGVLVAADVLHSGGHLLLANKDLSSEKKQERMIESFIPTRNKNLDFFLPMHWEEKYPEKLTKEFNFDYNEINDRYQFVIFDIQRGTDPFTYPHYSLFRVSHLEPILRNAQVLTTIEPYSALLDSLEFSISKIKKQKRIYPDAEFLGTFIINRWRYTKIERRYYEENVKEIKELIGEKLFKTRIEFQTGFTHKSYKDLEAKLFSRKTNMFKNYSVLVDEMLQRLNIKL